MITIGIDPNLFQLGPFTVSWHGLLTAVGVLFGVWLAVAIAKRGNSGITEDDVYNMALWVVPGGIIGARLFHVVDKWGYYSLNPGAIFALHDGGLAVMGGIFGGVVTWLVYSRVKGIAIAPLAAPAAFGLIVGQIIGRMGCIINGDAYGIPTDLSWAFVYTNPGAYAPLGVPGHPTPVYEILWDLVVLGGLILLRRRMNHQGAIFLVYMAGYAFGRFFITFLRQNDIIFMGLKEAQLLSLLFMAISIPWLAYLYLRPARAYPVETRASQP
ncbi:MAG: prolipoprotein diacylglyceryl transferase [Chloroflexi bacterium]|nr:prolipoprotein diacylglyceryl transferase [Chloroflexota bacterium]